MSRVTVSCPSLGFSVRAYMGETPPTMTGGYGGWSITDRPRRVGLSTWDGRQPLQMTLPLKLDGWKVDQSVEGEVAILERMALPITEYATPPIVFVSRPAPHASLEWVIQSIEFGDAIRRADGDRLRQDVVLTLLQYIDDDVLQLSNAAQRARDKARNTSGAGDRAYVVKAGDTLVSIAVKELGTAYRWTEIADMNGIRDGNGLIEGDQLRIP